MIDRPKGCASLGDLLAILVCLFALCVFAHEGDARELQPTAIVGSSGELPLDGYMELFVDPSRTLDLGDVLRASAQFHPISGHGINLGYTTDAVWLRIRVGAGEWQRVLLSLTPNFVDLVDVYVAADRPGLAADDFKHYATGDHRPFSADDTLSGLDNVVPLQLQPDAAMLVYIRLASVNSSLNLSAVLYSPTVHTFRVTVQGLVAGAWFGGMAVLLIIQLVFFHFSRPIRWAFRPTRSPESCADRYGAPTPDMSRARASAYRSSSASRAPTVERLRSTARSVSAPRSESSSRCLRRDSAPRRLRSGSMQLS
ncbi:hypothetical protein GRB70_39930 [Bradyrhizobium neotropicale]|nr:7TM-DISM domain-containing protein [Bradyrhizobium neotropicale]MBO4228469.1 hypothetical protein [Bradyrhizobium neotropicale]